MTYRIGSLGEFAEWTKRVIRDPQAMSGNPGKWFETEEAAARAELVSAEAMVKLLSPGNLAMLDAIKRHHPASVRELAALIGRKEASLSRTLKRLAQLGIVGFEDGPHRARIPAVLATRVHLDIDLVGQHGAIAVETR